ncbi:MAG: hypothetical protein HWN51_07540 [Desulfobacterales bacterium]|nr:hypothetical protein [Desulfobacterales bacterium]
MVRFSQGDNEGDEPPWALVDGRNDRARALDGVVRAWELAHPVPEVKRPSELKRKDGLQLVKKFGVAICMRRPGVRRRSSRFVPNSTTGICGYLIVVKKGEKLPRCGGCGKRVWVKYGDVIFQHDDPEVARIIIQSLKGWQGRGKTIDRLPVAKMGAWARRAEERIGVGLFYKFLPWNLVKS